MNEKCLVPQSWIHFIGFEKSENKKSIERPQPKEAACNDELYNLYNL